MPSQALDVGPADMTAAPSPPGADDRFRVLVWLAAAAVASANLLKPLHIDDTLYVTIARWIVDHPLDPYGGPILWQQVVEPSYRVSISPPLLSYYFAAVIAIFGESELSLHLSMMPWLALAAWGLGSLSRRWTGTSWPAVVVMASPAVAVGCNLMLDVPLLAGIAASLESLYRALEPPRRWPWLLAALLLSAAATLTKYPALLLVPVALVTAWCHRRGLPLIVALGPLAALVGWQTCSHVLYGAMQVEQGLGFLSRFRFDLAQMTIERTLSMLAIFGMTFPLWLAALGCRRGWLLLGLGAVAASSSAAMVPPSRPLPATTQVAFWVSVALGLTFVVYAAGPALARWRSWIRPHPDDVHLPLTVWVLAGAAFVILFGPFVAVRSFLPIQFPLAVLTQRALASRRNAPLVRGLSLALTAALAVVLATADSRWARLYPTWADTLAREFPPATRTVYFLGHWGWQYYAERAGMSPWDASTAQPPPSGTIFIIPQRADPQFLHPAVQVRLRLVKRLVAPPHPLWISTWNRARGLRFYGGDFGEIPWGLSPESTEELWIFEFSEVFLPNLERGRHTVSAPQGYRP